MCSGLGGGGAFKSGHRYWQWSNENAENSALIFICFKMRWELHDTFVIDYHFRIQTEDGESHFCECSPVWEKKNLASRMLVK